MAVDRTGGIGNTYMSPVAQEKARAERQAVKDLEMQNQNQALIEKTADNRRIDNMDRVELAEKRRLRAKAVDDIFEERRAEEAHMERRKERGNNIDITG